MVSVRGPLAWGTLLLGLALLGAAPQKGRDVLRPRPWPGPGTGPAVQVNTKDDAEPVPDPREAGQAVRASFRGQSYPWYDARDDRVVPVLPQPDLESGIWKRIGDRISSWLAPIGRFFRRMNATRVPGIGGMGDLIAIGLALLFLTLVVVTLMELLRRYRPLKDTEAAAKAVVTGGKLARIEGLQSDMPLNLADPWAEAQRLRDLGDYAGAIVHLFAHQILTLVRVRLLRLIPGRTGRQLVRSVTDRGLRSYVEPTLRLFEAVYYGHHSPSADDFEAVWSQTGAFEQRVAHLAAGGAS